MALGVLRSSSRRRCGTIVLTTISLVGCSPVASPDIAADLSIPASVTAGAPVEVRLRLTNTTGQNIVLYGIVDQSRSFQIVVTTVRGVLVWRRIDGLIDFPPGERVLAPDEHVELFATWNQSDANGIPVAPGRYRIQGSLWGATARTAAEKEFTIVSR